MRSNLLLWFEFTNSKQAWISFNEYLKWCHYTMPLRLRGSCKKVSLELLPNWIHFLIFTKTSLSLQTYIPNPFEQHTLQKRNIVKWLIGNQKQAKSKASQTNSLTSSLKINNLTPMLEDSHLNVSNAINQGTSQINAYLGSSWTMWKTMSMQKVN